MNCRFCKADGVSNRNMVKYGTRHYAHHLCYMKAKGAEGFKALPAWKLRQFPYMVAKELGLLPALEAAIKADEARR